MVPVVKTDNRKPDAIEENDTRIKFTSATGDHQKWIAEVNRGQSTFDDGFQDEFVSFGSYAGDDSGWFMTLDEAKRLHAWLGKRIAEK